MKTITINLPTSIRELRTMLKERRSKRFQHNVEVLRKLVKDIIQEVESGYWRNDISDIMKDRVFNNSYGRIIAFYNNAKNNLQ